MAYFALANARASEITFQRAVHSVQQLHLDAVSSQCSYAKINRNPTFAPGKREIRGTFLPICIRRLRDFFR